MTAVALDPVTPAAQKLAAETRGLILADTKYEFGVDRRGPRSSSPTRSTPPTAAATGAPPPIHARFEAGEKPESFDKDFVRNWVAARCDPYHDPIPQIPPDLIDATARIYIEAFETITGETFTPPSPTQDILARIRHNLAPWFQP